MSQHNGIPEQRQSPENEGSDFAIDMTREAQEASNKFFAAMQERHLMGQAKYGPIKFAEVNTLNEAMEEVIDLANYAMYTFMKLYILNKQVAQLVDTQPEMLGPSTFVKDK